MDYSIQVKNVFFAKSGKEIFKDLSFYVKKGEFLSLIGKSGSGKTTLFRLLANLEKPMQGSIEIATEISYMTQYPLLLPRRSVLNNLMLIHELNPSKESAKGWREKALFFLNEVGLVKYLDYYPSELSGGMKARVSLARVLLENKPILLLDEPFASLDAITREEMQSLVLALQQKYCKTIFLVTHDILEAIRLSQRLYLLADGKMKRCWDIPQDAKEHKEIAADVLFALS